MVWFCGLFSYSALLRNQAAFVLKLHAHIESIDSIDIGEGVGWKMTECGQSGYIRKSPLVLVKQHKKYRHMQLNPLDDLFIWKQLY